MGKTYVFKLSWTAKGSTNNDELFAASWSDVFSRCQATFGDPFGHYENTTTEISVKLIGEASPAQLAERARERQEFDESAMSVDRLPEW